MARLQSPASDALAQIKRRFLEQLPDRLSLIRELFEQIDCEEPPSQVFTDFLQRVHDLTGSAGTFGLPEISIRAREINHKLSHANETFCAPGAELWAEVAAALYHLEQVADRQMQTGSPVGLPPLDRGKGGHSPLVHIVEDDLDQARFIQGLIEPQGYRTRIFPNTQDFLSAWDGGQRPAVVLMDMEFPEGRRAGANAIQLVRFTADEPLPVIFMSVHDDIKSRLAALRAGATRYLVKPVDPLHLLPMLDNLSGVMPTRPYRVLLVDDDLALLEVLSEHLRQAGFEVMTLSEPLSALKAIRKFQPEVLVLDVFMPEASGTELASVIREDESLFWMPILFLSAETDITTQLQALSLGGDDFLVKPVAPAHLIFSLRSRAIRARRMQEMFVRLAQAQASLAPT